MLETEGFPSRGGCKSFNSPFTYRETLVCSHPPASLPWGKLWSESSLESVLLSFLPLLLPSKPLFAHESLVVSRLEKMGTIASFLCLHFFLSTLWTQDKIAKMNNDLWYVWADSLGAEGNPLVRACLGALATNTHNIWARIGPAWRGCMRHWHHSV